MTRDEAIASTKAAMCHPGGIVWCSNQEEANAAIARIEREAEHFVDASAALGMIKLDEPKSGHQRMVEACRALDLSGWTIDLVATALDNCGLKVVEK